MNVERTEESKRSAARLSPPARPRQASIPCSYCTIRKANIGLRFYTYDPFNSRSPPACPLSLDYLSSALGASRTTRPIKVKFALTVSDGMFTAGLTSCRGYVWYS